MRADPRRPAEPLLIAVAAVVVAVAVPFGCAATAPAERSGPVSEPIAADRAGADSRSDLAFGAPPVAAGGCAARVGERGIRRAALRRTVDAGLGQWLQGVQLEPRLLRGRFQGWVVQSLHPDDPCYRDVDLQAGDLVLRVNGRSVERPEEAHAVWKALPDARALRVDYLRDGAARTLSFAIED